MVRKILNQFEVLGNENSLKMASKVKNKLFNMSELRTPITPFHSSYVHSQHGEKPRPSRANEPQESLRMSTAFLEVGESTAVADSMA